MRFVPLFALLLLVGCSNPSAPDFNHFTDCRPGVDSRCQEAKEVTRSLLLHGSDTVRVEYELADTSMKRTVGLMYRDGLAENTGMLFDFGQNVTGTFWMKNMEFDLDMLFISQEGIVLDVIEDVPACDADPCPGYGPTMAYYHVLEVNAGFAKKHGIVEGTRIEFIDSVE